MNIRVEASSLATTALSGVSYYTKRLTEALDRSSQATVTASYFNFKNRQPTPDLRLTGPLDPNTRIPLRVYAKLQSYGVAPPFDIGKSNVDLTIFPNFATWPSRHSRIQATVVHDLTYLYLPEVVESKNLAHLRRVVPRSIKQADFIITVSESVKAELVKEFQLDPNNCVVTSIPPGAAFFERNDNEVHKKYGIPTQKYIYFIGNLEPRKDLPTLIRAYQLLPQAIKDEYSLVLAGGKGWKVEESKQALKDAQDAGENVVHIGYVDQEDSPALFQKASLFVMPSIYEGFGMPILEAMASNIPVIASNIPVLRETGGEAALYASPKDPASFCKKITEVLSSPTLVDELNAKAKLQLQKVSWENNAERIISHAQKFQ